MINGIGDRIANGIGDRIEDHIEAGIAHATSNCMVIFSQLPYPLPPFSLAPLATRPVRSPNPIHLTVSRATARAWMGCSAAGFDGGRA